MAVCITSSAADIRIALSILASLQKTMKQAAVTFPPDHLHEKCFHPAMHTWWMDVTAQRFVIFRMLNELCLQPNIMKDNISDLHAFSFTFSLLLGCMSPVSHSKSSQTSVIIFPFPPYGHDTWGLLIVSWSMCTPWPCYVSFITSLVIKLIHLIVKKDTPYKLSPHTCVIDVEKTIWISSKVSSTLSLSPFPVIF